MPLTSVGLATCRQSSRRPQYRVCLCGLHAQSQHALLVPEGSAIHSLEDIKGNKVAFAKGSSAHNVTLRLLAKAGLS